MASLSPSRSSRDVPVGQVSGRNAGTVALGSRSGKSVLVMPSAPAHAGTQDALELQAVPKARTRNEAAVRDGIYLDYAATTPLDPVVVRTMVGFLQAVDSFGNPASLHSYGHIAAEAVERARTEVASLLTARPEEIIWTSGATEAINLAIKGATLARKDRRKHIVTSPLEHKAVLDTVDWLTTQGFQVSYVEPDETGVITPTRLAGALRADTSLVSLMQVNNETGAITDIAALEPVLRDHPAWFHVDMAQSLARLPATTVSRVDLVSISAHKMYGPKGIGALRVRSPLLTELAPQTHGGRHELGLRSGTLPTHQIVGMGRAAAMVRQRRHIDAAHTEDLDDCLRGHLDDIDGVAFNSDRAHSVPGIVSVAFPGVDAESLVLALSDIAFSTGSACASNAISPSHVLTALGYSEPRVLSSVRLSFGRFTTIADIDYVGQTLQDTVPLLRRVAL